MQPLIKTMHILLPFYHPHSSMLRTPPSSTQHLSVHPSPLLPTHACIPPLSSLFTLNVMKCIPPLICSHTHALTFSLLPRTHACTSPLSSPTLMHACTSLLSSLQTHACPPPLSFPLLLFLLPPPTLRFNFWGLILWIPIGIKQVSVMDELDCDCKKCSDIGDFRECINTHPCPNETNPNSFCYWKPCKLPDKKDIDNLTFFDPSTSIDSIANSIVDPRIWGYCDCCHITPCPDGQFFDRRICMCRCRRRLCLPPSIQDQSSCNCVPKLW